MKAVIVEIRKNNAAALTDDGCVIKIRNDNYAIGEVLYLKKNQNGRKSKFTLLVSLAAAVVILFGITAWAYCTPYTYVSLDVNPSIEYQVNRFDRVLSADAVNDDGTEILKDINVANMTIDEAVKCTVNEIEEKGYFEGQDPGGIVISTSSEDEEQAQQLAQQLQEIAKQETEGSTVPVEVEALSVGLQRVNEAHALGTTPGKLNLVQKLQAGSAVPNEVNIEEWLHKPVKEIMKAVKQNRKDTEAKNKQQTDSTDLPEESQSSSTKSKSIQTVEKEQNSVNNNTSLKIKENNNKSKNSRADLTDSKTKAKEQEKSDTSNNKNTKKSEKADTSNNKNAKKNNSNDDNKEKSNQKQSNNKSIHSKK